MVPIGLCAQLACLWEASARKPGNVAPGQHFDDSTYLDYLKSAAAIAPVLDTAWKRRVGETVLASVLATKQVTTSNTNLGIILLLAPLATVAGQPLRQGLPGVLERLDVEDARLVYEAIRLVNPAGLGRVAEQDVNDKPTRTLRAVMALASERDLIALQYVNGFAQVLDELPASLRRGLADGLGLEEAIVRTQLAFLSEHPDSLIARKLGPEAAREVSERARQVAQDGRDRAAFDAWLRAAGHDRNPGTTADLIAAALFVGLREGSLSPRELFTAAPT